MPEFDGMNEVAVLARGERTEDEWEDYIRDAGIENTILTRAERWAEFQAECRAKHGRQGGSRFAEFARERFGLDQSSAGKWAAIGKACDELWNIIPKFSPDWLAFYLWTTLTDTQKQRLLTSGEQISQKTIKRIAYGHSEKDGDEWYTPAWLFDALGLQFSIDVCAPADRTHSSVPSDKHYTEDDDGLKSPWSGTIWCNPPYSTPEPWALKCIEHGDGLLLTHIPMNAGWCADVWQACKGIRLFQAIEFVRPDGKTQRPGTWLQLAAFGETAYEALRELEVPKDIAENPRRVPSPLWVMDE